MEFKLLNNATPEAIKTASASLSDANILEISSKIKDVVDKLSIKQFLFVMGCLCKFGTHFEKNIDLIDRYLPLIESDLVSLSVEKILYGSFLKGKYETEDCYNAYFEIFSKHDKYQEKNITCGAVDNSIWFFTHTPVFLAHTNAMFKLLKGNNDCNVKVKIASLSHNDKYQKKCNDLGAEFICLSGNNTTERYGSLINQSKNALALIWNGAPIHLDYVSKRSDNVVWWTHRFHPNIERVKLRISSKPAENARPIYFGAQWNYFHCGFELKNWNKTPHWQDRKYNFGSFCRETLIDDEKHWQNVRAVLSLNEKLIYNYAGRTIIHDHWCEKLNIDKKRVNFLGWLASPETKIMDMAFLLDGNVLGQGVMAMEAVAGKIPVIHPNGIPGFYSSFMNDVAFRSAEKKVLQKVGFLVFHNQEELCSIVDMLLDQAVNSELGQILHKNFSERARNVGTFGQFCGLIKNEQPHLSLPDQK